jgi:hypothetical protein
LGGEVHELYLPVVHISGDGYQPSTAVKYPYA